MVTTTGERIEVTDEGFTVKLGDEDVGYLRLEVAAKLCGIHPQSLQRLWRTSNSTDATRIGTKLGRTCFFTLSDLAALGYAAPTPQNGGTN